MAEASPQLLPQPLPARRVVFYDGVCGFCDRSVSWLLARDPEGRFRFAALQGETAAELRARHPQLPRDLDTLVYVESEGGRERVFLRSRAIFRLLAQLDPPWRWLAWLRWLPRPLTDLGYRLFARIRYRVFGRLESCRLPTAEERARFLP